MPVPHAKRGHAKYSPSGFERILNCPGSVALSVGMPDKESAASKAGTKTHEVMERMLRGQSINAMSDITPEMVHHAGDAATFIKKEHMRSGDGSDLLVETKVDISFIHSEFWGSLDAAIVDHFDTLNIIDAKFGTHLVSPEKNYQLLAYALGVAHKFDWNFRKVKLTIIQPRARGYNGPSFWELPIAELKSYVKIFKKAIHRAEVEPKVYEEGEWCFFCKAKSKCPLKTKGRLEKAKALFTMDF